MTDKQNQSTEYKFKLAIENHSKKNFKLAEAIYIEILKIKPNHVNTLNNLGELYRVIGKLKNAKNC